MVDRTGFGDAPLSPGFGEAVDTGGGLCCGGCC